MQAGLLAGGDTATPAELAPLPPPPPLPSGRPFTCCLLFNASRVAMARVRLANRTLWVAHASALAEAVDAMARAGRVPAGRAPDWAPGALASRAFSALGPTALAAAPMPPYEKAERGTGGGGGDYSGGAGTTGEGAQQGETEALFSLVDLHAAFKDTYAFAGTQEGRRAPFSACATRSGSQSEGGGRTERRHGAKEKGRM